jgi:ribosomal protein L24E
MSCKINFTTASFEVPEMFFRSQGPPRSVEQMIMMMKIFLINFIYRSSSLPRIFHVKLVKVQSFTILVTCYKVWKRLTHTSQCCEMKLLYTFPTVISTFYCTWCIEKYTGKMIIHSTVQVLNFMFFTCRRNSVKFSAPHERLRWLDLEECSTHPDIQIIHKTPQT